MSVLKTIAMYLPQFHEVPENNEWWGKGYTEWTAVKSAEPLFADHNQPREPLNDNYYNLLEKSTMEQQAAMAREYALDGFCFYHYYFKDGRKILEKPAENLLKWKDIDMPFCFCWANETWGRTWSRIKNVGTYLNTWAERYEEKNDIGKKSDGILLEQKYGREEEWKAHLEYLVPFFKDDRYIKREGMPILLIYKPQDIPCLCDMIDYWKKEAKEYGINNIYIIGMNTIRNIVGLDAILFQGPRMYYMHGTRERNIKTYWKNGIRNYQYEDVWENAIKAEPVPGCRTYFGAFTDYDDTPRRGENGFFLDNTSMKVFEKYLHLLMEKNKKAGNEYVFINAFNEWGEGMYLEPDKKNGCQYLEILRDTKERVNKEKQECIDTEYTIGEDFESAYKRKAEKGWAYVYLMDKWMTLREEKRSLSEYLKKYQYKRVAIYGMGILGRHLAAELLKEGIVIEYIIDRKAKVQNFGIKVCNLNAELSVVDAIIVTAVYDFDRIWKNIRTYDISYPVLSLAQMIYEL